MLLGAVIVVGMVAFTGIRPTQSWILWLTAGLAALSTDGLVRSHRHWEDPRAYGSVAHALLPALIVLGTGHFIDHAIDGYARTAAAIAVGVAAGFVAWVEYRTADPSAPGYGTARLVLAVAAYFTAFTLFAVVFTADLSRWIGAVLCAGVSFFLGLELLRESRRLGASSFLVALAIGVSLAELRLGMYYFPLDGLLAGAIMVLGFYLATGLVHHLLDHDLEWSTAAEYLLVASFGTAAVVITRLAT